MTNPDQPASETREEPLPCPFCGDRPARLDGPFDRDERRSIAFKPPCGCHDMEIWILNIGETESARQLATKQWNERVVVASGGEESNPQSAAQIDARQIMLCDKCGQHAEICTCQFVPALEHQTESASAPTPETVFRVYEGLLDTVNTREATIIKLREELSATKAEIQDLVKKATDLGEIAARNGDESRRLREAFSKLQKSVSQKWGQFSQERMDEPEAVALYEVMKACDEALSAPATVKEQVRGGEWVEKVADSLLMHVAIVPASRWNIAEFSKIIRAHLSESPSDQGWRPIEHGEVIVTGDKIQTRLNGRVDAYAWLVGTRYKDGCAPMYRKLPNPPTGEIKEQG